MTQVPDPFDRVVVAVTRAQEASQMEAARLAQRRIIFESNWMNAIRSEAASADTKLVSLRICFGKFAVVSNALHPSIRVGLVQLDIFIPEDGIRYPILEFSMKDTELVSVKSEGCKFDRLLALTDLVPTMKIREVLADYVLAVFKAA